MVWACLNKGVYQICVLSSRFLVSLLCAALAFFDKTQKFKHTLRDLPTNRIKIVENEKFLGLKIGLWAAIWTSAVQRNSANTH